MASTIKDVNKINQIISENIDDPIFILNEKLICEYVNFGDFGEVRNFIDFIHPNDSKRVIKFLKNIFKVRHGIGESRIKAGDGHFKWFEIKGKRIIDSNNKKQLFLICKDITKFKKIEEEYKENQERFGELTDSLPEIRYWKLLQSKEGVTIVQKTREMLDLVIDNIPQLIYWKDTNLVYLGCNRNFALINGIKEPSNIIGRRDNDLIWLKVELDQIQESERKVMNDNKPEYNVIESLTTSDGNQAWFEINRIPLQDSKGKVVGILVTYEDITNRRLAEQKLKESEEKYRGILANIKETYFEVDLKGSITFFNDSFVDLIGYSKNELLDVNYQNFVDEENKNKIFAIFNEVYQTTQPKSDFQFQIRKKNGALVTCESSVYLRYDSEGNKIGFNGIVRNITEKYFLEKKLKESEEKYRTIFTASPDYIFITDIKGNILDMNPALLERIGMTLEEIHGMNFSKFYAGDKLDELREVGAAIVQGKEIKGVKIKAQNKRGEIFEYEVNSVPLKEDGKVTKILNLARDITLRKQTERKLKESEKKYRHLFESSPYSIWLMDDEGTILDCNSTMTSLLSTLEIEDLIGKKFSDVLLVLKRPGYLISMLKDRFKRFKEGEKLGLLELQITRVDGKKIWLSISASLVKIGDKILTQAIIQDITEKKNSEKRLKDSEKKYRHLFEKSPYSIILVNRKGKIIDCNPITEKIFQRKINDLINKSFLDVRIKPEKILPLFKKRYETILEGKVPEALEVQISRSKDGRAMWINIDDSLVEVEGETVFQVIIQDITEKKVAEQKLKKSKEELKALNKELEQKVLERTKNLIESEQQYRTTIDSLNDPLHVVDKDLKIILVNKEFKKWLSELNINADIFGRKIPEAFPFLPNKVYEEYKEVFDTGIPLITTETTILPNANVITETRKIPIFSEGKVEQIITIIRDITESKEMENQLKKSEEKFRNMVNNLDVGFYRGELKGKLKMHNQAFNRILGLGPNKSVVGVQSSRFFANEEIQEKYYKELEEKGFIRNFIAQVRKINGGMIIINVNAHLIYNSEGEIKEVEGTFTDITEKFKLEQELLESEKKLREQNIKLMKLDQVKNDFITMAAHELKTPLISISGYTDYILMKYRSLLNPVITRDLLTVRRNISRLEVLMDQLLEVLKIDENELKLQKELINVSKLINNCLDELSYLINEKNLEIILNIDHKIVLNVDSTRIFTIFTNLISNAIKFTHDFGWIEISAKREENNYLFEVKDNGIGLTKDEIDRLFKKFERIKQPFVSNNIIVKDSGTGLGLYITKGIINAHGGKIWANSEGENKGTTFSFTLPV